MKHLQIHQQREHKDQLRHFCSTCKMGFLEKDEMIKHRQAQTCSQNFPPFNVMLFIFFCCSVA